MNVIRRLASYFLLVGVYGFTWLVAVLARRIPRRRWRPTGRIVVTGTFFNPNWYLSHITPLTRSGIKEVILVTDTPQQPIEGVTFSCPPRWLQTVVSRAGAKAIWMVITGLRHRPDLYMGYHIFPSAVSALCVARLSNRPACYQDTSGPLELEGGGWHAENRILAALGGPSRVVEAVVRRIVREFDLVVVRGTKAADYVRELGYKNHLAVITGSVETEQEWRERDNREIDVVFVGRLTECKRADRFVSIVADVAERNPGIRATVVGDGPDRDALTKQSSDMGVEDKLTFLGTRDDVPTLLSMSKVYVLTSRWEGLSIAMIEAMANGAVPVVSDVGDLRDIVTDGVNGYVIAQDDIAGFSAAVSHLLDNKALWRAMSLAAVAAATEYSGVEAVSKKWQCYLHKMISESSGVPEEVVAACTP